MKRLIAEACKKCHHGKIYHQKEGCKWLHQGAGGGLFGMRCSCTNFEEDKEQDKENAAYLKLTKMAYKVEMSEAYVPIHMRRYEVWTNRECIFKGDFNEFIKFTEEQDDKTDS